jgi:hypothetical protein
MSSRSGTTAAPPHAPASPAASDPQISARAPARVADALAALARLCQRLDAAGLAREATAALEPLDEGLLRVVALGQFKRGKSTLLNSLMGAPLLPTGVAPVTSVATLVRWAPEPQLSVVFADGRQEDIPFGRLPDLVVDDRNPGNALGVAHVEVGYPCSLLADGIVLVDTPGVGSTDRGATERAYGFLPRVDAGVVVLSPDPPLGEAEADYVRTLASYTPHILFVLNKIDRVSEDEWREALVFNRRMLAAALDRPAEDIELVPVSARAALDDGGASVATLRRKLVSFVTSRGSLVRDDLARRRLRSVASVLHARLEVERKALDLEAEELDRRIALLRDARASLEQRAVRAAATVMAAVERIVADAGDDLVARARAAAPELAAALHGLVAEAPRSEGNAALVARFDAALEEGAVAALEAWWHERGPAAEGGVLDEMKEAARNAAGVRHEAAVWIAQAFGIESPSEPCPDVLRDSVGFYRSVEGVTPKMTVDMLRLVLPRSAYRAWLKGRVKRLVTQSLEMGAGQVRGDLLYRARETTRAFLADLKSWTLEGIDGLADAAGRATALRDRTGVAAEARREELDQALGELGALLELPSIAEARGR